MISEDELKTVGDSETEASIETPETFVDPILKEQKEQAEQMRSALLTCKKNDITSAKVALQNIAVLQVYHQVARIIRYTELMDRIEDKLYDSIDMNLAQMDECDPSTMMMLLKVQAQLQESMVLSQKLLEPYMNIDLASIAPPVEITEATSFGAAIIPKESRNVIRNGAQALLTELRNAEKPSESNEQPEGETEEVDDGNPTTDAARTE